MAIKETGLVEIGDNIFIKQPGSMSTFTITRVTDTLAYSKKSGGSEDVFKREISDNMGHPVQRFNVAEYIVSTKE